MKCPNCELVDMLKVGRFFECDECGHVIERKIKSTFTMEYRPDLPIESLKGCSEMTDCSSNNQSSH